MSYESLRQRALPHRFVTVFAALAVVFIAAASGISAAPASDSGDRYRLDWSVRPGPAAEQWTFRGILVDTDTNTTVAGPTIAFVRNSGASFTTKVDAERIFAVDIRDNGSTIDVDPRVTENGRPVQVTKYNAPPQPGTAPGRRYTGAPISMNLKDADIKDVLKTFANLSGLKIEYSPALQGSVTVNVTDMPWDEAFDLVIRQNNLTWEMRDGVAYVK